MQKWVLRATALGMAAGALLWGAQAFSEPVMTVVSGYSVKAYCAAPAKFLLKRSSHRPDDRLLLAIYGLKQAYFSR